VGCAVSEISTYPGGAAMTVDATVNRLARKIASLQIFIEYFLVLLIT
jgi:hypothetical protein